jgi:thiamine-phosphate pyrophosphorylase
MRGHEWRDGIVAQVVVAARAGMPLIQVRERDLDAGALRDLVARCLDVVRGTGTRILVNDRLDVALAAGAHGVHLRGDSMPASRVRTLCPRPFLIGRSIHTVDEARRADASALDYLVFGTVFAAVSKPGREPAGVGELAAVVAATTLPILAVGGVTLETMPAVMRAGAAGAAAIGLFAHDVAQVVPRLLEARN